MVIQVARVSELPARVFEPQPSSLELLLTFGIKLIDRGLVVGVRINPLLLGAVDVAVPEEVAHAALKGGVPGLKEPLQEAQAHVPIAVKRLHDHEVTLREENVLFGSRPYAARLSLSEGVHIGEDSV